MAGETITAAEVIAAIHRATAAMKAAAPQLTELDNALGDGDLGITVTKAADALEAYLAENPEVGEDLGKFLSAAGMKINGAAPSTMGTLLSTAVMRAGKAIKGRAALDPAALAAMLMAAAEGIQERGKANRGDKTILDALFPAAEALAASLEAGEDLPTAGRKMVEAAQAGLEAVTPIRSKIGRAGWVGERTEGAVDPGCAACVAILEGLAQPG